MNNETLLIAFVGLTALALLVQATILVAIFFAAKKTIGKLLQDSEEYRDTLLPFLTASRDILTKVGPKIEPIAEDVVKTVASVRVISGDVADFTVKMRGQVANVETTTADVLDKVKVQTARIDGMVTQTLDAADRMGGYIEQTVSAPVRKVSGILAAAKAIVESLRSTKPAAAHVQPATDPVADTEDFV